MEIKPQINSNYQNWLNQFDGLETPNAEKLAEKVVVFRNDFFRNSISRYFEKLVNMFTYAQKNNWRIDSTQLEYLLRNNFSVAVGLDAKNRMVILGTVANKNLVNQFATTFYNRRLNQNDILFTIPESQRLKNYLEITNEDTNAIGNFVVFTNKKINLVSDFSIIENRFSLISELELSRFSLAMQSRFMTVVAGEKGSVETKAIVAALYNAEPYAEIGDAVDFKQQIWQSELGAGISDIFSKLKEEEKDHFAFLDETFGLNTSGLIKESGVSDEEVEQNNDDRDLNYSIYFNSRFESLRKLNIRFKNGLDFYKVRGTHR